MLIRRLSLIVLLTLPLITACVPGQRPGTSQYQRYQAAVHDPYPDGDLGPEVVGGRPRDFQKPLAEPVRNRWLNDSWWKR